MELLFLSAVLCYLLLLKFSRGITPLSLSFKHHSVESKSLCLPRSLCVSHPQVCVWIKTEAAAGTAFLVCQCTLGNTTPRYFSPLSFLKQTWHCVTSTLQNNRVGAEIRISVCTQARRTHFYLVGPPVCLRARRDVRAGRLQNITIQNKVWCSSFSSNCHVYDYMGLYTCLGARASQSLNTIHDNTYISTVNIGSTRSFPSLRGYCLSGATSMNG